MTDLDLVVSNVVGWISYPQELDLAALEDTLKNRSEIMSVKYEPSKVHWLQTNIAPDGTYVAFYRSGRCSITGVDSVEQFNDVVERVNAVMKNLLEFDSTPESRVTNIVVTTSIGMNVQLESIALQLGLENVEYEPEQFPGLIYRDYETGAVIFLFASGKLLCTGLDDLVEINDVIERFTKKMNLGT
jgi:transcription initiation factor TFIID TATA-box-binding protein